VGATTKRAPSASLSPSRDLARRSDASRTNGYKREYLRVSTMWYPIRIKDLERSRLLERIIDIRGDTPRPSYILERKEVSSMEKERSVVSACNNNGE